MVRRLVLLAAAAASLVPAAQAAVPNAPWPQALPALPLAPAAQPHAVEHCAVPGLDCVSDLERRLRDLWTALDATCDHRAVAALAYLRITEELHRDMAGPAPGLVADHAWMGAVIATFSNRYFASLRAAEEGRPVPESWRIAYDAARDADVNAGQDVLLFSNAHVQRDLPFAYEEMGLRTPDGRSHKPDHDAVNEVNARIFDPLQDEIGARYDPTLVTMDAQASLLDEVGVLELVKSWREAAWRSAERLVAARTPAQRALVVAEIEQRAATWARMIAAVEAPGHRARRDAHCAAFHAQR